MKKVFLFLLVALLSSFVIPDKKVVHNFSLKNVDGKIVSLSDYPDAKGFIIVFTCNHCPLQNYILSASMT
ncbi:MAG: redoxin domain-containing protein [Bacteroidetes bacterium]|nr:redoxin domain-containing protein [Bacteroidota bacterium]